ncbi:hypothetical protein VFPFJ_08665 [Purpureocillium lilacinum]|uniref:Uncharacterized protein n=1 Tax=Purpureocillium lilacinum TaxID=33203 RepID=A0A179GYJ5_PURLI|nr:hypothetical protein VFPFJ_08665 [Purpureocillium lilacinum]OAQ82862.1 hypothetical protein VFPFJ_08665 [Purpureocillium lilacinum]
MYNGRADVARREAGSGRLRRPSCARSGTCKASQGWRRADEKRATKCAASEGTRAVVRSVQELARLPVAREEGEEKDGQRRGAGCCWELEVR